MADLCLLSICLHKIFGDYCTMKLRFIDIFGFGCKSRSFGGPKGRRAEPHRHHGKEKETHEGFSLWLSWLAVLLVGAYARRRRRRRSRATWPPYSSQLAYRDMYPRILAEECRLFLAGFLKKIK